MTLPRSNTKMPVRAAQRRATRVMLLQLGLLAAMLVGCGPIAPATHPVTGTVTLAGAPLAEVAVLFVPDGQTGKPRVESSAVTDAQGKYELVFSVRATDSNVPRSGKGAVAGMHTVTVADYKMAAEHLPPPGRVPQRYTQIGRTPLRYEVQEGPQQIDIQLE